MQTDENEKGHPGVSIPTVKLFLLVAVALFLWLSFGSSGTSVRFRRWYNLKRVYWRRKLGYRDDSKYKMQAGGGASQKYKRQG